MDTYHLSKPQASGVQDMSTKTNCRVEPVALRDDFLVPTPTT